MTESAVEIAALYNWRHARGPNVKGYADIAIADIERLQHYVDLAGARVCDVGCGNGEHLRALVAAGVNYPVGIDLSEVALSALLDDKCAPSFVLLHGNVIRWRARALFDVVICSLPPLTSHGDQNLDRFISCLHDLLRPKGYAFLKLFTQERAVSIVGTYAVQYDGAKVMRHSRISLAIDGRCMTIEQHYGDAPNDIRLEELDLPSEKEIREKLCAAGFRVECICDPCKGNMLGTETFIARLL